MKKNSEEDFDIIMRNAAIADNLAFEAYQNEDIKAQARYRKIADALRRQAAELPSW